MTDIRHCEAAKGGKATKQSQKARLLRPATAGLAKTLIWTSIIAAYLVFSGFSWGVYQKNEKGNRLYKTGKYEDALKEYKEAQIDRPNSPQLSYNIGNALHENKVYDSSLKEYQRALASKDKTFRERAFYNLGNSHFRLEDYLSAIHAYEEALKIDPKDEDAKYNLELAKKKLKQKKEEEKKQQQQQKQQQKEQQPQGGAGEKEKQEQQNKEEEKKKQEQEKQEQEKQQQQQPQGQQQRPAGMSKEEAEKLLDAVKDNEKRARKEGLPAAATAAAHAGKPTFRKRTIDKDW